MFNVNMLPETLLIKEVDNNSPLKRIHYQTYIFSIKYLFFLMYTNIKTYKISFFKARSMKKDNYRLFATQLHKHFNSVFHPMKFSDTTELQLGISLVRK